MDEAYDAIILGTGLTECVLSGLLATADGQKLLIMDRNEYYGGEAASLNLEQFFQKLGKDKPTGDLGPSRDYNIDLVSKLLMANGKLVKMLQKTGVIRYGTEFTLIDGSFVVHKGKVLKVPVTETEALSSSLMGILEKRRAAKFFSFVQSYEDAKPATHKGHDLTTMTMRELYAKFGLSDSTIDFIGHAIALQETEKYMDLPALPLVKKIQLYEDSLSLYQEARAPYVYPLYGLGELPQCFARLGAVHGGTFMLRKPVDKIHYDENGRFCGVESEGEIVRAKKVIGDPSYFPDKVRKTGQTVRCICLMKSPPPGVVKEIKDAKSCQIIISGKETKRASDIYVTTLSGIHKVVPENMYLGLVSTTVESEDPEKDLAPGLALLSNITQKFVTISDTFEPLASGHEDGVYISKSYDASTHFESTSNDILNLFERITGKTYDLTVKPEEK
ncbi:Guanosine nucleotide diphosphate dissociation inhibitor 2 [Diplonema papillatum]|nr:Guanosine nucleotide diphosphate dissociation inhibitor 2 [Diplonema papillatum]